MGTLGWTGIGFRGGIPGVTELAVESSLAPAEAAALALVISSGVLIDQKALSGVQKGVPRSLVSARLCPVCAGEDRV